MVVEDRGGREQACDRTSVAGYVLGHTRRVTKIYTQRANTPTIQSPQLRVAEAAPTISPRGYRPAGGPTGW